MSRSAHSCFIAFAMFALGWAQVFGMTRGYLCSCSGMVEITQSDHCHGDEVLGCHHDDEPLHSHEEHEGEDSHEHALLKDSPESQVLSFPQLAAISPMATDLEAFVFSRTTIQPMSLSYLMSGNVVEWGRRWPQVLTRTIALRV